MWGKEKLSGNKAQINPNISTPKYNESTVKEKYKSRKTYVGTC